MRKIILSAAVFCAVCVMASCNKTQAEPVTRQLSEPVTVVVEHIYADSVEEAIDICYDAACTYLTHVYGSTVAYDSTATDEFKMFVIRKADLEDADGDVMPEVPEYDEIAEILWPKGYGNL